VVSEEPLLSIAGAREADDHTVLIASVASAESACTGVARGTPSTHRIGGRSSARRSLPTTWRPVGSTADGLTERAPAGIWSAWGSGSRVTGQARLSADRVAERVGAVEARQSRDCASSELTNSGTATSAVHPAAKLPNQRNDAGAIAGVLR
jgi:hypothetical protein